MIHNLMRMAAAALISGAPVGALVNSAAAQESYNARSSAPTGTQSNVTGNPNCPPPVINGITPKNWSCKTGEGSSYILPQTTSVQPGPQYGAPGSYLQPDVGPPGSYLQKDVGPPGSYLQPDVGPPGSYLNSTQGGTQVHTGPGGAIILTPGPNQNAKPAPNTNARANQTPTPGVNAPYRQDIGAMRGGVYSNVDPNYAPYRQDLGAMQGGVTSQGYSFGPQNPTAQAVQGLAGLIGKSMAQVATAKTASAKNAAAKSAAAKKAQAAAANAQAARLVNGVINMLGSQPSAP